MTAETLDRLRRGERNLPVPLPLDAPGVGELVCHEILRLQPARRLVARTCWQGRDAVLKLFLGHAARRYRAREARGLAMLRDAGLSAPPLLAELELAADALALVLGYVPGARLLDAADHSDMVRAVTALAAAHQQGVWQQDLNLANLVDGESGVVFVDGDGIGSSSGALGAAASLRNLALLLAERPLGVDAELPGLLEHYQRARGWAAAPLQAANLTRELTAARRQRVRRYLDKTGRDCTEFAVSRAPGAWAVRRRDWEVADWRRLFAEPDAVVDAAQVLKAGNSATVVRWRPTGQAAVIIKRYNLKSPYHAARRALKPRARRAWRNANQLHFLGVPTARPLALLERRRAGLAGVAYLVLEDLGDGELAGEIADDGLSDARCAEVAALFSALGRAGLAHGDAKVSNLLIAPDGTVRLVDVDALRSARYGRRDVARFLANFSGDVRARFARAFEQEGLC